METCALVGRQPILDRDQRAFGHELLYRSADGGGPAGVDGDRMTSRVVLDAFLAIGIERVVGNGLAFVNVTREFLLDDDPPPLPRERVVLEILEDAVIDEELIGAVRSWRERGFTIALDDFVYDPRWEPLLPLASVIKVEVPALDEAGLAEHVRRLRRDGVRLLAEKVETRAEFEELRALGFDLFQGYFFARPEVVSGRRLPENRLATVQLLGALQRPDVDLAKVDALVSQDVALSYKLLRCINSAAFALPRRVESIHRAVVFLGLRALKRLVALAAMAGAEDKPSELVRIALVRARMCERLCAALPGIDEDSGFTVGLFSTLESLMDAPLAEILDKLPLAEEVSAALLAGEGLLGEVLACVLAYERCDWDHARAAGLDPAAIGRAYAEAVDWSYQISAGLV